MKFHKLKHEAALNFGCNEPSHPSEWRSVSHKLVHLKTIAQVNWCAFSKTCKEKAGAKILPQTHTHMYLHLRGKMFCKIYLS